MKSTAYKKFSIYILFIAAVVASIWIGVGSLRLSEIFVSGSNSNLIFFDSRMPRTISLIIAGFGLSISGLVFQRISNNKFVCATTSGSVSGAQLGLAVSMAFLSNPSTLTKMLFGMVFSLAVSFVFMTIVRRLKYKSLIFVPLVGIMLSSIIASMATFLGISFNFLQALEGWFVGSLSLVISGRFELLYIVIPAVMIIFIYARQFTIVGFGEDYSINVGLNYNLFVTIGLILISIITASTVIIIGYLPFLGLVVPNIMSLMFGDNLKKNVLTVGIFGSLFLLICDIFSRIIIYPYELSVSLVMGIIGTVIFLFMIFRGRVAQ